jgi:peptide chain release factor 2
LIKRPRISGGIFDVDSKQKRIAELNLQSENPDVWNNPKLLNKYNQEKSFLEKSLGDYNDLKQRLDDNRVLLDMATEAQDEDTFKEVQSELKALQKLHDEIELKTLLNGESDINNAYVAINSGAGGTESCDWANMLLRMYTRYADKQGYSLETLEMTNGETAGIKSVSLLISGPFAYGNLKSESGVHRLVRISPFDSNARRHTSFASVFVYPEVDDDINIVVKDEDLRIDTYRASGAGGQHVNKTDSAVRMTHLPTGIVVQCQSERSQHTNRDKAMKMMKAALYERELAERQKEKDAMNATKKAVEWGSQIRSYVMHPYQMVKDHRTSYESSQVQDVMDGYLEDFVYAYLKDQVSGET